MDMPNQCSGENVKGGLARELIEVVSMNTSDIACRINMSYAAA